MNTEPEQLADTQQAKDALAELVWNAASAEARGFNPARLSQITMIAIYLAANGESAQSAGLQKNFLTEAAASKFLSAAEAGKWAQN